MRKTGLDGFTEDGPLSSDPVALVFSALATVLPTLPPQGWSEVFDLVLRPEAPHPANPALDVISTAHATAVGIVAGQNAGWTGDWHQQWQICSLATAASFTTFTSLGPKQRWWSSGWPPTSGGPSSRTAHRHRQSASW